MNMHKKVKLCFFVVFILGFLSLYSSADEGMWILDSIERLPIDSLKAKGLELEPEEIYNPEGGGLADAVVRMGGTGSFVSPKGLFLTNHHVVFSAVQKQSTPENNYLRDGFCAKTKEEELPAIGYSAYVTKSFEDVTNRVLRVVNDKMNDLERYKAIEKITKTIIAQAEKNRDVKCSVVSMYGGMKYYLFTYFKIKDIRLVFVPPRSIGDYGGDIDNWMWPRHAGDFAFVRAYVEPDGKSAEYSEENVPYNSKAYLKISSKGVREGDLVMLLGFPGRTQRYESSSSTEDRVNFDYPLSIGNSQDLISILEKSSVGDSALAMKLSSRIKGIANYLKKYQGMLEGFKKTNLLERKIETERSLKEFLDVNPKLDAKYGLVLQELDSLYQNYRSFKEKDFLVRWMRYSSRFLDFAATIYKWSLEKEKKDLEREPGYQDRDIEDTKRWLEDAQVNLVPSADKRVLVYYFKRALQLPEAHRISAVEKIFEGKENQDKEKTIEDFASYLYQNTKLGSVEQRLLMYDLTKEKLDDPFIDFAKELEKDREELRIRNKRFKGALKRLEPKLISAYFEWRKTDLYPDANYTIRFNYGEVKGYAPEDAVSYNYMTTLRGVLEKDTGEEPFDAPDELEGVYNKKDFGSYFDKNTADVPVNFLSTNDITNGNSGSPVMNGKGELVGIAFDGNYESMTSDYQFDPELTRAINVDVRYVLFLLDRVYNAKALLEELSID